MESVETGNTLKLSIFASVDGVSLHGNSKKKIWPCTLKLADLPTAEMQKSENIMLEAIVEGVKNPSTTFWNTLLPFIFTDIEGKTGQVNGTSFSAKIVSFTADQPAKRSLFGFAAPNSELSCFYGLCSGTLHKKRGQERYTVRQGDLTKQDGLSGTNGFKNVPPKILDKILPYDTIVDVLHNLPEGLLDIIMTEMKGTTKKAKSPLFKDPNGTTEALAENVLCSPYFRKMKRQRNATEKLNYFRVHIGLAALVNESIDSKARVVLISLMLLCNHMYSGCEIAGGFYFHLCDVAKRVLMEASPTYMTIKVHEVLEHLPYVFWKFGNPAPLSTFSYESYYKFSLTGFNPQLTTGFIETAAMRFVAQNYVTSRSTLNELVKPAKEQKSAETAQDSDWTIANLDAPLVKMAAPKSTPEARSGSYEKPVKVSHSDAWIPAEFMRRACIDPVTGHPYSREDCDRNIDNLLKTRRKIDYYGLVENACQVDVVVDPQTSYLTSAFSLLMLEKVRNEKKVKNTSAPVTQINTAKGFNLAQAKAVDSPVAFPGGLVIKVTDMITTATLLLSIIGRLHRVGYSSYHCTFIAIIECFFGRPGDFVTPYVIGSRKKLMMHFLDRPKRRDISL
ncbi:unnamed protein product [Caenorhabditis sp. 36 PRJEB53466]|nr:unnamed protein product [Caenorhabditis sp. 36 PRJEB53466]